MAAASARFLRLLAWGGVGGCRLPAAWCWWCNAPQRRAAMRSSASNADACAVAERARVASFRQQHGSFGNAIFRALRVYAGGFRLAAAGGPCGRVAVAGVFDGSWSLIAIAAWLPVLFARVCRRQAVRWLRRVAATKHPASGTTTATPDSNCVLLPGRRSHSRWSRFPRPHCGDCQIRPLRSGSVLVRLRNCAAWVGAMLPNGEVLQAASRAICGGWSAGGLARVLERNYKAASVPRQHCTATSATHSPAPAAAAATTTTTGSSNGCRRQAAPARALLPWTEQNECSPAGASCCACRSSWLARLVPKRSRFGTCA